VEKNVCLWTKSPFFFGFLSKYRHNLLKTNKNLTLIHRTKRNLKEVKKEKWITYPPKIKGFRAKKLAKPLKGKAEDEYLGKVIHKTKKVAVDNPYLSTFRWIERLCVYTV
jgi:hypothetical protein